MNLQLKDKTVLITGSTSGIGYATAKLLAQEKAIVYINGRISTSVSQAIQQLKSEVKEARVFGKVGDFSHSNTAHLITADLPPIDILINNVGEYDSKAFFETPDSTWENHFQVNVMSGVRLSQILLKGMLERNWGRILFISSECAYLVPPDMISYSASKAALHAISKGLAQLTKSTGVTVNVVAPGSTLSQGAETFLAQKAESTGKKAEEVAKDFFSADRSQSLLQRFAAPKEIAQTIVYLCSPLSSATNGAVIKTDGGSTSGVF